MSNPAILLDKNQPSDVWGKSRAFLVGFRTSGHTGFYGASGGAPPHSARLDSDPYGIGRRPIRFAEIRRHLPPGPLLHFMDNLSLAPTRWTWRRYKYFLSVTFPPINLLLVVL